jgi:glyceraldehyde 3-phosphate dehydrogenase
MAVKVAINGFGRIGKILFRLMEDDPNFNIVAINDLGDPETLTHLLKYDTTHGRYKTESISFTNNSIIVDGHSINVYSEKNPGDLPWRELDVDIVFECTGVFAKKDKSYPHIEAGAKKVIISAPAGDDLKTIVYNVNHEILDGSEEIISCASCTTNCLAPVLKVLNDNYKVERGLMTTIHAYTNDQVNLDVAHRKGIYSRRGKAAAANVIPTSTGAAKAIGLVLPELNGKLNGIALRVPVIDGSIIDLTVELSKLVSKEEINDTFNRNTNETIKYTEDPITSSDVIGTQFGALVDGLSTDVIDVDDRQLIKILAWYDNEMGYCIQMIRTAKYLIDKMQK